MWRWLNMTAALLGVFSGTVIGAALGFVIVPAIMVIVGIEVGRGLALIAWVLTIAGAVGGGILGGRLAWTRRKD